MMSAFAVAPAAWAAPVLGRWDGSAGRARIVFTIEQNAILENFVVQTTIFCGSQDVELNSGPWPISATGAFPGSVGHFPFSGRFGATSGTFTVHDRSEGGCARDGKRFTARSDPAAPGVSDGRWKVSLGQHEGASPYESVDFSTHDQGNFIQSSWSVNDGCYGGTFDNMLVNANGSFERTTTVPGPGPTITFHISGRFLPGGTLVEGTYTLSGDDGNCSGQPVAWTATLARPYAPVRLPYPKLGNPTRCAAVRVIGVRGSGEDPHTDRAMGELPYALAGTLAQRLRPVHVTGEGLDYPAVGLVPGTSNFDPIAYSSSVSQGDRELPALMRRRHHECPNEKWVLAAYSQGAQVLGDVLAKHPPGSSQVVAVVLWADPKYSPRSPSDRGGAKGWGILSNRHKGNRPPRSWTSRTESWCNPVDIVCQGVGINHTPSAHLTYQNWALSPAESFATTKVKAALTGH